MCRIAGMINRQSNSLGFEINTMRDAMAHGGPDAAGCYIDASAGVALGHRRLAIIDLSAEGNQPMTDESGELVLVFNGKIYNYRELRKELEGLGHRFRTRTDTEVILVAYQQWGMGCFARFDGIFALALYDKKAGQMVLARDHAGIKPLYFFNDGYRLYFASEVRSFEALNGRWPEDQHWRVFLLTYGFLPDATTTLKGVRPLQKGTVLVVDVHTMALHSETFFRERYTETITDPVEARKAVAGALRAAVERQLVADAPLGLFLSGGIDSSLLTLLASEHRSEIQTISIIFDDPSFDESKYQELVVRRAGTRHQAFQMTRQLFTDSIPDIFRAMDQPSTDGINSYFISKVAHEAGLKAVLSGLGADELFGGYPSFSRSQMIRRLNSMPAGLLEATRFAPNNSWQKIAFLGMASPMGEYLFNRGYFIPVETARILDMDLAEVRSVLADQSLDAGAASLGFFNRTSYLESELYMQHQLLKDTDFMSMWYGLEVRVPFLDKDLVSLVQSIGSDIKAGLGRGKQLLIDSFRQELPAEIWNRKKQGFSFPFAVWMQDSADQYIHSKTGRQIRDRFRKGQLSWSRYWAFVLLQAFLANRKQPISVSHIPANLFS